MRRAFYRHIDADPAVGGPSIDRFGLAPMMPKATTLSTPISTLELIDTVPGDTSTTAVLTVGAPMTISAINTIGDQDFYRVDLVAGHEYSISLVGYLPAGVGSPLGPIGLPLLDSYLELYDSTGHLITSADGGADTTINGVNSGFDAQLTFTATATGTYYVNARAFDNIAADGDHGDLIGDYGLFAKDVTDDPGVYRAYYDPNSPLYAIDWGTRVNKVHQSVANPDGNEGTRDTGNVPAAVDPGAASGHPGKNVISIYFAKAGDIFVSNDLTNPGLPPATITATGVQQFEHDAVVTALGEFSRVADIVYVEVSDRTLADFIYTSYIGTPGPGVSLLGSMSPPDESDEGLAQFNSGDYRWNALNLQQGGFSYVTLIHEFGHGHGLAHPHDNGGHSGIMNGVTANGPVADYTTGDFALNQAVFTMMSYQDGWVDSPYGNAPTDVGYGYLGGLMAFDIAAIQDKYGVNEEWATGDDVYVLKDVNAAGTYYTSIWDAGGSDSIMYDGARDTNIDLRPATLKYEVGGGGYVSYATGIFGGFTIASGVLIENAMGGSGNDTLTGNDAGNSLNGGAGNDTLAGGLGDDVYVVDSVGDVVIELVDGGSDLIKSSISYTLAEGSHVEALRLTGTNNNSATGNSSYNKLLGNPGDNTLDGGGGGDVLRGGLGNDTYIIRDAVDRIVEIDTTGVADVVKAAVSYVLESDAWIETLMTIDALATTGIDLTGNAHTSTIQGNAGANLLTAGSGNETISGLGGADIFAFGHGTGQDSVGDFLSGTDRIDLSAFGFASFAALQAATHDVGGNVVIDLGGGDSVTLTGVLAAQLQSGDVILGGGGGGGGGGTFDTAAIDPGMARDGGVEPYDHMDPSLLAGMRAVHHFGFGDGPALMPMI